MELGAMDTCGSIRVTASSKVAMPCSWNSRWVRVRTGVAVAFRRWWWPVPVTTTGFRSCERSARAESVRVIW